MRAMEMVKGIPCYSCSDVDKAMAGLMSPRQEEALAALHQPVLPKPDEIRGVNQPLADGPRGTLLNFAV
jgi:hypothetical protein